MQLEIGDLVRIVGFTGIYIVHRRKDSVYKGYIGVTNVKTGEKTQTNTTFVVKVKTDKN